MMHFFYYFSICNLCISMNLTLVNNKFRDRRNSKQSSCKLLKTHLPQFWYKSNQTSSAQWGTILCSSWHTTVSDDKENKIVNFLLGKGSQTFFSSLPTSYGRELPSHGSNLDPVLSWVRLESATTDWAKDYPDGIIKHEITNRLGMHVSHRHLFIYSLLGEWGSLGKEGYGAQFPW